MATWQPTTSSPPRQVLAGRPASWATLELLVAAYGERQNPPEPPMLDLYRACALVRIVHGWSRFRESPDLASPLLAEAERFLRGPGS
jgi:hypothetical protein